MSSLTKNDINLIDNVASQIGFCQPWDLPVEKLPFHVLIALCQKVCDLEKRLEQSDSRWVELSIKIIDLEKRVCNTEENIFHVGINNGVKCNE